MTHEQRDEELKQAITDLGSNLDRRMRGLETQMGTMEKKMEPVYDLFNSTTGFARISLGILKFLAASGAAILGIYAILEFLKKLGK